MTQEGRRHFIVDKGEMSVRTYWMSGCLVCDESVAAATLFGGARFERSIAPGKPPVSVTELVVRLLDGTEFFRVRTSRNAVCLEDLYDAVKGKGTYEIDELNDMSLLIGGVLATLSVMCLLSVWGLHRLLLQRFREVINDSLRDRYDDK